MESVYYEQQQQFDNYPSQTDISGEELQSRQELLALMKQDLQYTHSSFDPSQSEQKSASDGFNLGRQAWKRRKEKRRNNVGVDGLESLNENPQPLSMKQQQFLQESIDRDAVFYEKLEQIHANVKVLGVMGGDMINEMEMQNVMLDEMDEKMNGLTEKLVSRNDQIKDILNSSGGAVRWCPIMILCVILLACIGYIWNAFIA
eukprot:CAMPEP_0201571828 /NCGR_PEP_ID=MMETSP0190_2-20130828/14788_1 /ASSEMBLY_ACC=CAM_ASM_000263 /TAXON_ID=37353 /ORGANISM="Rosalina sp." /LENGTH=201 /DNA_ID=CAMNT_0047996917 /DNA_START=340 /DNA_END=945 /DNA_ORIENTATION=+